MSKIISLEKAAEKSKELRKQGKGVILAGGCFDILHRGHIEFLKNAKKLKGNLFVLLESDETIRKTKGSNRPINLQNDRAAILESLEMVDWVLLLPKMIGNEEYDRLIFMLKPTIIATTKGDPQKFHKERQAKLVGAKIVEVVSRIDNVSTTRITELIEKDL